MPMPKPKKDESKKDFLDRCMGDDVMVKDYEDEKQRYAICNSLWKKNKDSQNDSKIEMRSYPIELRLDESDGKPKIHGHAALFNELSVDLGGFREKIKKGTFKNTILDSDIKALKNHDSNLILGRNMSGTLVLEEDYKGLKMIIDPPNTTYANDLIESMKRGDIDQCSFAFRTIVDEWDYEDKNNVIRTLKEVELFDVSIVTYPAYPQTSAGIRTAEEVYKDFNKSLQEKEKLDEDKKAEEVRAQERKAQLRNIKIEMIKRGLI